MTKRSYTRRSDDEIIADLQSRIRHLEQRMESKQRPDVAVLKEIPKLKKSLGRISQLCVDNGRGDLANSILAFLTTFEMQARDLPEEAKRSVSSS